MTNTPQNREPQQKRSIEKKNRIIEASFELFSIQGYHDTNTTDIADKAGVSTGTVYSYFKDKKDIYIAAFEHFFDVRVKPLLEDLVTTSSPIDLQVFISKCIDLFVEIFSHAKRAMTELSIIQESDPEIMAHFEKYEDEILTTIVVALGNLNVNKENLKEKIFILYVLVEALGAEQAFFYHKSLDTEILKREATKLLLNMLQQPD